MAVSISGNSVLAGKTQVGQAFLLDDYRDAAAAYSLRKLRYAYSGSAVRVRRSSDNAEQDIGFSNNNLDETSLLSFCGSGSGYVTKWYDQSGNARHAVQGALNNQPRIVNAGVVEKDGNLIKVVFDGTNDSLYVSYSSGLTISPTSFYTVSAKSVNDNKYRIIFSTGILNIATSGYGSFYADSTYNSNLYVQYRISSIIGSVGNYNIALNTNSLIFSTITTTDTNAWLNGGNNQSASYSATNTTTTQDIYIGSNGDINRCLNGYIFEIVMWQSNKSSVRTGIESNINTYYNIY